ncbi:hypothetical protein [Dysgonomonas sp. ZJ709]|uniref:hypothetical protein n=1 Tax=Dysgonomonas sp. ZJ709 TaxID=2709797 RepID=UPI0013EAFFB7|nr:hypothetical protein [Dysgonomonas sp. ZJ709]
MNLNLYTLAIAGTILLGIVHILSTFVFYPAFDEASYWFIGTGLGIIFAGLANYMNYRINKPLTYQCVFIINSLLLIFALLLSVRMFIHIPAILVTMFSLLLLICCLKQKKY